MTHSCFLCDPGNPDQAVEGKTIRFGDRFVGPPRRAHGGIAVGSLLCPSRGSQIAENWAAYVSGRLHRPVPLNTDLEVDLGADDLQKIVVGDADGAAISGAVRLHSGDLKPGEFIQEAPEALLDHLEEMSALVGTPLDGPSLVSQSVAYRDKDRAQNGCYGCSEQSHALRHKIYRTDGKDVVSRYFPEPEHFDASGRLDAGIIAAVTDCPNLWVLMAQHEDLGAALLKDEGKVWITGTHSVHYLRVPERRDEYRTVTRILSQEGRKGFTCVALFDLDGALYAVAEAVSILIEAPPEMR